MSSGEVRLGVASAAAASGVCLPINPDKRIRGLVVGEMGGPKQFKDTSSVGSRRVESVRREKGTLQS